MTRHVGRIAFGAVADSAATPFAYMRNLTRLGSTHSVDEIKNCLLAGAVFSPEHFDEPVVKSPRNECARS